MNKKLTLVGAAIVLAVAFALPVAAIIAGLLAWFTPLAFWPTLAYAALGGGAFNGLINYRRIKAQLDWANS